MKTLTEEFLNFSLKIIHKINLFILILKYLFLILFNKYLF